MYDLGLAPEDFYSLTMAQFYALTLRHQHAREQTELLMGISTATLANHSANPPKKAYDAYYFMPSKQIEKQRQVPKPKRRTRQALAEDIRAAFRAMGGRVVYKNADGTDAAMPAD